MNLLEVVFFANSSVLLILALSNRRSTFKAFFRYSSVILRAEWIENCMNRLIERNNMTFNWNPGASDASTLCPTGITNLV